MKKIVAIAIIFVNMSLFSYVNTSSPKAVVAQLYSIYKNKDFRKALFITTGKEHKKIKKVISQINRNFGRPPLHVSNFIAKIDDFKLLDEVKVTRNNQDYAVVNVLWILKIRDKDNRRRYKLKANEVGYILKKIKNKWLIKNSKLGKQHVFHNYAALQRIYRKALPFSNKKPKKK